MDAEHPSIYYSVPTVESASETQLHKSQQNREIAQLVGIHTMDGYAGYAGSRHAAQHHPEWFIPTDADLTLDGIG